jgi:glycosyltransferase involved in cell wall biosynthesis
LQITNSDSESVFKSSTTNSVIIYREHEHPEWNMLQGQTIEQAKVVIGITAYNEEATIARTLVGMRGVADEVLLCDDGSSDSTSEIAEAMNCKVLSNAHKLGPVEALRTLFLAALKSEADVLVVLPTKTPFERNDVSKLSDAVLNKECDIALGSRVQLELPKSESELSGEVLTAAGIPLKDPQSPFRAYNKQALSKLVSYIRDDNDILTYAMKLGLNISEYQLSSLTGNPENMGTLHGKKGKKQKVRAGRRFPIPLPLDKLYSFHPTEAYGLLSILSLVGGGVVMAYTAYQYFKLGVYGTLNIEIALTLFIIGTILTIGTALLDSLNKSEIE